MAHDGSSKTPFNPHDASRIARDLFAIEATAKPLPSYDDQNFLMSVSPTEQYVLKLSNSNEHRPVVEGQNAMLTHLALTFASSNQPETNTFEVPRIVECVDGSDITIVKDTQGRPHLARLITYLHGTPMADCRAVSPRLLHHLGASMATMSHALRSFTHPGLNRDWIWDLRNAAQVAEFTSVHTDPKHRAIIDRIFEQHIRRTSPILETLPRGIIHGDANDYNLIIDKTNPDQVAGLIDFGDAIHTALVCEIAITIAYAMLRRPDPVAAAAAVLAGYTSIDPLSPDELRLIPDLALTRLAVSVTQSVRERALDPDNTYISVTEEPAWKAITTIDVLPHGTFESVLLAASPGAAQ